MSPVPMPSRDIKKKENGLMSTFLLSYFLRFSEFVDQFLVVAAHGALNGFVGKQAFQRLLA